MWTPSSESEETNPIPKHNANTKIESSRSSSSNASHLNAKQANEITLRQIKNATLLERGKNIAATDVARADDCELENLLRDVDGQEEKCNKQQLLPQSSSGSSFNINSNLRANKYETHAMPKDSTNTHHLDKAAVSAINVGSSNDNVDKNTLEMEQLKSDKMTQYGSNNGGSHAHSKLDIQKIPEVMQQQQNAATIIPTQATSLNATTMATLPVTMIPTKTATTALTMTTTAQGVSVVLNTENINNEGNGRVHNTEHYKGPKFWQYIVRYWSTTSQKISLFLIFLLFWALAYCIYSKNVGLDNGIIRMILLFVGAELAGVLVTHLLLPDMLGMLFFGVFYTNVGLADFSGYEKLEAILRESALINIMLLAGLGLNASAFKKLWFMILRLTVLPTIAEVLIITVLAKYLLLMPWLWGILLGLVITAVSPNVVVTVMLKLKEDRLGLNSGIHTIVYAVTTCNDVLAIFGFGVVLGVIFSTDSLTEQILQGPVGIGIGIVFGYIYGMLLQYLPSKKSNYLNGLRFVLTILGGCIAVMGSKAIGYPSAGALGCATLAFIASIGWKRQQHQMTSEQQHANENSSTPKRLDLLWKFLKPVSFSLIGKEINFSALDGTVVGYGLLLIALGSLFRLIFAYISTFGGHFTWKERAYITISGFPKATVQAALSPIALDLVRSMIVIDQEQLLFSQNVLVISVLAIIFTAPLGAILMLRLAPHWLQQSSNSTDDDIVGVDGDCFGINKKHGNTGDILVHSLSKFSSESNLSYGSNKSQATIDVAASTADDSAGNDNFIETARIDLKSKI